MLRHVSEKSTDAILPGFVWAAILLVTVGVVGLVSVVSIVQLFGAQNFAQNCISSNSDNYNYIERRRAVHY